MQAQHTWRSRPIFLTSTFQDFQAEQYILLNICGQEYAVGK